MLSWNIKSVKLLTSYQKYRFFSTLHKFIQKKIVYTARRRCKWNLIILEIVFIVAYGFFPWNFLETFVKEFDGYMLHSSVVFVWVCTRFSVASSFSHCHLVYTIACKCEIITVMDKIDVIYLKILLTWMYSVLSREITPGMMLKCNFLQSGEISESLYRFYSVICKWVSFMC